MTLGTLEGENAHLFKGKEFGLDMGTVIRKYDINWIIVESE